MNKVQQAAHDIKKKGVHALSTAARGHLLRLDRFLQPHPGGPIWDSRHVKGGPFAQRRGPEYAGCCSHILRPRSLPCWQCVANFLKHLALSIGSCAVSAGPIHAKLVVRGSSTQAAAFELCCARGWCLPGMLRYSHRLCMQKDEVRGRGSWSNSAQNSSQVHVQSRY